MYGQHWTWTERTCMTRSQDVQGKSNWVHPKGKDSWKEGRSLRENSAILVLLRSILVNTFSIRVATLYLCVLNHLKRLLCQTFLFHFKWHVCIPKHCYHGPLCSCKHAQSHKVLMPYNVILAGKLCDRRRSMPSQMTHITQAGKVVPSHTALCDSSFKPSAPFRLPEILFYAWNSTFGMRTMTRRMWPWQSSRTSEQKAPSKVYVVW